MLPPGDYKFSMISVLILKGNLHQILRKLEIIGAHGTEKNELVHFRLYPPSTTSVWAVM